jgi:signal transduction histidine kinase
VKIRHRILILIVLPLICQLITAGLLAYSWAQVEQRAQSEVHAKKVVSLVDKVGNLLVQNIMLVSSATIQVEKSESDAIEGVNKELESTTAQLCKAIKDEPGMSEVAKRLQINTRRHVANWKELGAIYRSGYQKFAFSQFLDHVEFMESMKVLYDQIAEDIHAIIKKYGPIASEFQPQGLKQSEVMRSTLISIFVSVGLLSFVFALTFSRRFFADWQVLMDNVQKFSRDEKTLQQLSGHDELAELDKAFREMSDEKQRLEEIRQAMRAMVSHDLRSPLTAINVRLDLMIAKYGSSLEPDVLLQLRRMYSESQRLVRLASTLLDVEKLEAGLIDLRLKQLTAVELVDESIEAVQTLAERQEITVLQSANEDALTTCDEDRSIQVLVNLLSNAIKFSPPQSTVEVKAEPVKGGFIRFSVLDEGPGVPPDKVDNLFSKFKQLDQADHVRKEGSGLGLYICKMLVESQGGKVGYQARPAGGSCFWFELPNADAA